MTSTPTFSIVMPTVGDMSRLRSTLDAVGAAFDGAPLEVIITVEDIADPTVDVARSLGSEAVHIAVSSLEGRVGRGGALRAAVEQPTAASVLIMDAARTADLSVVPAMREALRGTDIVIGSRSIAGSVVHDPSRLGRVMGRLSNWLARRILGLTVHDASCGLMMMHSDTARIVIGVSELDGVAVDAEVLRIASILDMTIVEVPVTWSAVGTPQVRPIRDTTRLLVDLMTTRRRLPPGSVIARARYLGWRSR